MPIQSDADRQAEGVTIINEDEKDTLVGDAIQDHPRPGPPAIDMLGPDVTGSGEAGVDRETQIMTFVRAQSAFIRAQIYFLEVGRNQIEDKAYIEHLTGFATAQAAFVKAQQDFLHIFGAV